VSTPTFIWSVIAAVLGSIVFEALKPSHMSDASAVDAIKEHLARADYKTVTVTILGACEGESAHSIKPSASNCKIKNC
jgi:Na+/H+-dicarboxylate symporter